MSKELLQRANDLKARNKKLEETPRSGFHDGDVDEANPHVDPRLRRKLAPQHNGLPPISEHVVPIYDVRDVHFVGDDAKRVYDAIKAHAVKLSNRSAATLDGTQRKLLYELADKMKLTDVDDVSRLTLWLQDWNDYLVALYAEGVGLSGLDVDPAKTTVAGA